MNNSIKGETGGLETITTIMDRRGTIRTLVSTIAGAQCRMGRSSNSTIKGDRREVATTRVVMVRAISGEVGVNRCSTRVCLMGRTNLVVKAHPHMVLGSVGPFHHRGTRLPVLGLGLLATIRRRTEQDHRTRRS